jgi:hypothetical protein
LRLGLRTRLLGSAAVMDKDVDLATLAVGGAFVVEGGVGVSSDDVPRVKETG